MGKATKIAHTFVTLLGNNGPITLTRFASEIFYCGKDQGKQAHGLLYFLFLFGIEPAENLPDMMISGSSCHTMQDPDTVLARRWSDCGQIGLIREASTQKFLFICLLKHE
jgi:hypothetical protein